MDKLIIDNVSKTFIDKRRQVTALAQASFSSTRLSLTSLSITPGVGGVFNSRVVDAGCCTDCEISGCKGCVSAVAKAAPDTVAGMASNGSVTPCAGLTVFMGGMRGTALRAPSPEGSGPSHITEPFGKPTWCRLLLGFPAGFGNVKTVSFSEDRFVIEVGSSTLGCADPR